MSYPILKSIHVFAAIATICGFLLRGYWMMTGSSKLELRLTRIAPHIIDTAFLLSGIALVVRMHLNVVSEPWLLAKIAGLIVYILLGTIAIKRGPTRQIRIAAFIGSLGVFAYIAGAALNKSPASWFAALFG